MQGPIMPFSFRGDLLRRIESFPKLYDEFVTYGEDLDYTLKLLVWCKKENMFLKKTQFYLSLSMKIPLHH